MNDGVALLLERMKTNPEEFAGDSPTKWKNLVDHYRRYLKKEDLVLLDNGMKELMQQRFTQKVMEELIDPNRKPTREEKIPLAGKTPIQYTADKLKTLGLTPIAGVTQTL
jgi:hypothetical protein